MREVFNFAAGPAVLPEEVLLRAQKEILNWNGTGMSVMEMSHRSPAFQSIFDRTNESLRGILNVPENYEILFLQGGASTQFAAVPLNLIGKTGKAEYAVTGNFAKKAMEEASLYGDIHIACDAGPSYTRIPRQEELVLDSEASYFHYCANNTIYGTEWNYVPDTNGVTLVCDMSSDILSRPVDVSKYGLIYAGAQKNMSPAGLTVVIIRKDLAGNALPFTPTMLRYDTMISKHSMYNTPPCWQIYMLGLQLDWLEEMGGISGIEKQKHEKAELLYGTLEQTSVFKLHADKDSRSEMNITFRTGSDVLDAKFVEAAKERNLLNLKGHRIAGGMRASVYNAMPMEGVKRLCDLIEEFDRNNK